VSPMTGIRARMKASVNICAELASRFLVHMDIMCVDDVPVDTRISCGYWDCICIIWNVRCIHICWEFQSFFA
jgi:hypothetical protein